jgi:hypothetical protein
MSSSSVQHTGTGRHEPLLQRWLVAFGRFWWDFLVGDTPELFIGTLAVIGTAYGLRHARVADIILTPTVALVFLFASVLRGRKTS